MSFFKNETTLPVLVTVMCVLIATVTILYGFNTGKFSWLENRNKKQVAVQKEEEKIVRTDYTDVARKTLDWIDKQRNEEGWYILERGCDFEKKTCEMVWDNKEGNKDGLIATWARLNFYEQHKDPKDLEIVKKDIDIFYDKYKDDNLKDSLWICKITYEMSQSKYLDEAIKTKLEEICFNSDFLIPEETEKIRELNAIRLKEIGKQKEIWKTWDGYNLIIRGWNVYFGYSTDMMNRYSWKKDEQYLNKAKEYFFISKKQSDNGDRLEIEDRCLIGLSSLDIYQLGNKEAIYLDYAKTIYEKFIIESEESRRIVTPVCGFFIKKMYQLTKDKKYLSNLEFFSNILIKFNSDDQINKVVSDGGFFKSNRGLIYNWYKNVVENGLIVELIRN